MASEELIMTFLDKNLYHNLKVWLSYDLGFCAPDLV